MRPCTCGHKKDNHFEIKFHHKASIFACRDIATCWCHNYTQIPNLKWLETQYEGKLKK